MESGINYASGLISHYGADVSLLQIFVCSRASKMASAKNRFGELLSSVPPRYGHKHDGCQAQGKGVATDTDTGAELGCHGIERAVPIGAMLKPDRVSSCAVASPKPIRGRKSGTFIT